ncbi:MAG: DNA primase [Clostridia bacterium]|nr:DNA primase [Clostridia bacterium]
MPMFPEYIIQEVAERNDIYDVVSKYVHLKKAGNSYVGLCPFHNEKTPSFSVSTQRGIFHCFGCGVGGNVISFVMKIENMPFYEAVKKLADMANIVLPQVTERSSEDIQRSRERRERIFEMNKVAAQFFYNNLKSSEKCIEYLKKRQINGNVAKKFWLGFAPDSWNSLFDYLKDKGYTESDIFDAGLVKRHESGRYYDMYRNRLMFPIFDVNNNIIAFGGRVFDDSKPKYLNSPESAVFSKSKNLYGINIARHSKKDFVMLTEGYMDTIALMKSGYLNTVATLGTALTVQQAKYLANNFKEVVICYDSDNAGCEARKRAITSLREYDIKISVIDMGACKDPDELIAKHGVDRFNVILNSRKTDMEFILDYCARGYDLENHRDVVSYIDDVLEYLRLVKSSVEQDVYVNMLSAATRVSATAIYSQLGVSKAKSPASSKGAVTDPLVLQLKKSGRTANDALNKTREFLLSLIIFNKNVYNKHKDAIGDNLFESDFHKRLLAYIRNCYETEGAVSAYKITAHFDGEEESSECARILSLDNRTDDADKAYADYIKVITAEMQKNKAKNLVEAASGNLEQLNELLKNRN